jgi:hypothetical protein
MIQILLFCEGSLDQGKEEFIEGEYVDSNGVMQNLIRKASKKQDIAFIIKKRRDMKNLTLLGGKYSAYSSTSRKLAQLAKMSNCTHIAYHRDEDNRGLENMHHEVEEYFAAAKDRGMSCLAIIPQHMTESWLLSDAGAFERAFSKKPVNLPLPPDPEHLWGNKHTANHPKQYMKRVLQQYNVSVSPDVFTEIAVHSDIKVLREKCPESFDKKFCMKMKEFISDEAD